MHGCFLPMPRSPTLLRASMLHHVQGGWGHMRWNFETVPSPTERSSKHVAICSLFPLALSGARATHAPM